MYNPLVSVIVSVYNVEKYLPTCLDSLVHQTYQHIEIIVVNDGSPDDSLSILSTYAENDCRIKIINQENAGISRARNKGVECSGGEYLMFVDADDWLDLKAVETTLSCIQASQSDVVLFPYIREYENKSLFRYLFSTDMVWKQNDFYHLYRRLFGLIENEMSDPSTTDVLGTVWGKLYKASAIKENAVRFIDLKTIGCAEDVLFNLHLFVYIKQAAYSNSCFYHYRKSNISSLTNLYRPTLSCQWENLYRYMQAVIDDFRLGEVFQTALNNRIALGIIGLGLNECASDAPSAMKVKKLLLILSADRYRKIYLNLSLSFFPIYWRFFFFLVKRRLGWGVYFLLLCIRKMMKIRS